MSGIPNATSSKSLEMLFMQIRANVAEKEAQRKAADDIARDTREMRKYIDGLSVWCNALQEENGRLRALVGSTHVHLGHYDSPLKNATPETGTGEDASRNSCNCVIGQLHRGDENDTAHEAPKRQDASVSDTCTCCVLRPPKYGRGLLAVQCVLHPSVTKQTERNALCITHMSGAVQPVSCTSNPMEHTRASSPDVATVGIARCKNTIEFAPVGISRAIRNIKELDTSIQCCSQWSGSCLCNKLKDLYTTYTQLNRYLLHPHLWSPYILRHTTLYGIRELLSHAQTPFYSRAYSNDCECKSYIPLCSFIERLKEDIKCYELTTDIKCVVENVHARE